MIYNEKPISGIKGVDPAIYTWPAWPDPPQDPNAIHFQNMKYNGISLGEILRDCGLNTSKPIVVVDTEDGFSVTGVYSQYSDTGNSVLYSRVDINVNQEQYEAGVRMYHVPYVDCVTYSYTYNPETKVFTRTDNIPHYSFPIVIYHSELMFLDESTHCNPTVIVEGTSLFGNIYNGHPGIDGTHGALWLDSRPRDWWSEYLLTDQIPRLAYYFRDDVRYPLTEALRNRCAYCPPPTQVLNYSAEDNITRIRQCFGDRIPQLQGITCDGVSYIGRYAFRNMPSFRYFYTSGSHNLTVGSYAFVGMSVLDATEVFGRCCCIESYGFASCNFSSYVVELSSCHLYSSAFYSASIPYLKLTDCLLDRQAIGYNYNLHNICLSHCTLDALGVDHTSATIVLLGSENTLLSTGLRCMSIYVEEPYLDFYKTAPMWESFSTSMYPLSELSSITREKFGLS